ncbi:rod shape-determining protein MreC [Ligilactobacillus ceti]|uniref:Cell shape-determining protein MreC n=1 Tax=Ligilactobacillus ceti DSM 22408 TaxID=1122146 RepID=A0A0R2KS38_9LACO|nr:rod shape-determining protein MreC [Ligilactobacillus ceti]KRN88973.1 rod shape-determining protein MreC [Ligilactobacillus ceti DSM 22408]
MKKYLLNKKLVIILISLIVSFLLIAFSISVRDKRNTPTFVQQIGNEAAGIVNRVVEFPIAGIKKANSSVIDLINAYQENQKLKAQVDQIAAEKVENQTLHKENQQLKEQLKLNRSLTTYNKVTAYVISRTPSTWQNQIIISKGSLAGVTKNSAVLSRKGLVGRVVEVNKTNSKVELITTKNEETDRFSVQVLSENGDVINGLITGYDIDSNRLIMGQITSKLKIKNKAHVITSGMGGSIPKGLFVGEVTDISNNEAGLPTKIYIKPAAATNDLSVVTVALRKD